MNLTANISVRGDPSVGIPHGNINVDFGDFTNYNDLFDAYDGGREQFRKGLKDWAEIWFDKSSVQFGDECPDCGHLIQGNCTNNHCPTNYNEYEE